MSKAKKHLPHGTNPFRYAGLDTSSDVLKPIIPEELTIPGNVSTCPLVLDARHCRSNSEGSLCALNPEPYNIQIVL
jgi:hypothetical protein